MVRLYGPDNKELMAVDALSREGGALVIQAKIFGTMPLTAKLYPEDARAMLRLLNFKLVLFLLTLPFRRSVNR